MAAAVPNDSSRRWRDRRLCRRRLRRESCPVGGCAPDPLRPCGPAPPEQPAAAHWGLAIFRICRLLFGVMDSETGRRIRYFFSDFKISAATGLAVNGTMAGWQPALVRPAAHASVGWKSPPSSWGTRDWYPSPTASPRGGVGSTGEEKGRPVGRRT